jgi:hypothetical protein
LPLSAIGRWAPYAGIKPLATFARVNAVLIDIFNVRVDAGDAMSIRLIAKELYRFQQEVEQLEKELARAPAEQYERLHDQLRKKRAERNRMRRALDGSKSE